MSRTCMVTGASGYLGGLVLSRMASRGPAVGTAWRPSAPGLVSCDLTDPLAVKDLLVQHEPDTVVHCAAWRDPDRCEEFPDEAALINSASARFICAALPPEAVFVLISSDYVFDGTSPPYTEDDSVCPVNVYGRTKVTAEQAALARGNSLVIRPPVLIGQELTGQGGFIAQMVSALRSERPADVDNVLVRFPVFGPDVAEAVEFLLAKRAAGVFHVSGEQGGTRWQWTLRTAALLGLQTDHLRPSRVIVPRRAARPPDSHLSTGKIKGLGFSGFTGFDEVVRRAVPFLSPSS
ncbi:MAG TPA: SDR family oxidoreductase [Kiritimatiellia bacterium]|nr:SDR family oxidoreductase [Kiritimatiellia bacterium]HPA77036.1 SDR family oxidoreductase [Kiritimatiellia bacterium]HQQ04120.1 SDR family oxidoreductase [Kiritimatiellia bacterium]